MVTLAGRAAIKGSSETMQMILLTFCAIGITFTWGIEMTYCTPYLLSLGLTKSNTSLVWVAGPLSGLIVQPIVGAIADESTSPWGRRRPLMVAGAAMVAVCLVVLGFTAEIVGLFLDDGERARRLTMVLAVLAIYAVDFAINAVMSCARSLIVDTLPIEKQQTGAAWAGRMNAVGHLIGYGAGAVDLVRLFGTGLGDTQFKQLTVIAAFAIVASTALTCWAVSERVLVPSRAAGHDGQFKVFRQVYSTLLNVHPRVQAICSAQFWSWIGWFPFLFYGTTWVGETYMRYELPPDARQSDDVLGDIGRIGSTALVIYSCVTFTGAFFLPLLIRSPDDAPYTPRPPPAVAGLLERLNKLKPDLVTAWVCGHLMFSAAMFMAPLARSFVSATVLMCLCGFPWTMAMLAPTTLLGIEVNKLGGGSSSDNASHLPYRRLSDHELGTNNSSQHHDDNDNDNDNDDNDDNASAASSTGGSLSGVYFGILNIYTTLPQFLGTFIATIVFAVMEPGKSPELATDGNADGGHDSPNGSNAIAVCLVIGAMSNLVAAFVTRKLRKL